MNNTFIWGKKPDEFCLQHQISGCAKLLLQWLCRNSKDCEPDRYGRGQKKNKSIQYDEDDPKYIAPLLKKDSPKLNQHHKLTFGESKKQGNSKPFTDAYYPRGTARGNHKYFRLLYKSKSGKWKEKHICGGNINLKVPIEKRKAIDEAIAQNKPIKILLEMCQ